MSVERKLTDRQRRFVDEYLIDLNATKAAVRAGYSVRTANKIGTELLGKTSISKLISERQSDRSKRTEVTQDMVLAEFAKIAFGDVRNLFNVDGSLIPITDLPKNSAAMIAGMEIRTIEGEDGALVSVKKIKLANRLDALNSVARHLGMFKDKIEVTGIEKMTPEQRKQRIAELQAKRNAAKNSDKPDA